MYPRFPGSDYGEGGYTCSGSPVQYKRQKGRKSAGRRTGAHLPPYGCTAIIYVDKSKTGYSNRSCISYNESGKPRQGQLGEVETSSKISEQDKVFEVEVEYQQPWNVEMVCGRVSQPPRDCKGHRGAVFMMGKGVTSSYLRKMKVSTGSSTETELIAADMFMPEMLWTLHFIQAQG